MEKLKATHPVEIEWRSYELRPPEAEPISAEYRARIEASRPQLYATAEARYGLKLNVGPFGINSRPALIGAKFAEVQGVGEAYHQAMFEAYWLNAQDISQVDVLGDVADSVGLDRAAYLAALDDPQWFALMRADVEQAFQYGLSAVPAVVFNLRYLVSGAQPYEAFAQIADKALAEMEAA